MLLVTFDTVAVTGPLDLNVLFFPTISKIF